MSSGPPLNVSGARAVVVLVKVHITSRVPAFYYLQRIYRKGEKENEERDAVRRGVRKAGVGEKAVAGKTGGGLRPRREGSSTKPLSLVQRNGVAACMLMHIRTAAYRLHAIGSIHYSINVAICIIKVCKIDAPRVNFSSASTHALSFSNVLCEPLVLLHCAFICVVLSCWQEISGGWCGAEEAGPQQAQWT